MNKQQAYINGFVKRASEYGCAPMEGIWLLKRAAALKEHVENEPTEDGTVININVPREKSHFLENSLVGLGGLVAAGGAGLNMGGREVSNRAEDILNKFNPSGIEEMQRFLKGTAGGVSENTKLQNFIEGGHELLNKKIFNTGNKGYTGYHVLDELYGNPMIASLIKKINPDFHGMNPGTREHYSEFSKSPLAAYKQLLKEQYGDKATNSYMDKIHKTRMNAVHNYRKGGKKTFLEHLAEELKNADTDQNRLGIDNAAGLGKKYHGEARKLESKLMHADPAAYREWRRMARVSNAGGEFDEQALKSLRQTGEHLYGKLNGEDIIHNSSKFNKYLKDALRGSSVAGEKIREVMSSHDFSLLSKEEQSKVLKHLISNGPALQGEQLSKDISKSFGGGRAAYRSLAGAAVKSHELFKKLKDKAMLARKYGKHGLAIGGGIAGLGLLARYLNRKPNQTTYQVKLPKTLKEEEEENKAGTI